MFWLILTKRNDATFIRVIEVIPPFDTITVAYIHKGFEKRWVKCKEMSSANEGEGMRIPLIKKA